MFQLQTTVVPTTEEGCSNDGGSLFQ